MNREERIEEYRAVSQTADNLATSGEMAQVLALLHEHLARATEAGDEDYRLFLEGEILHYDRDDNSTQLELMQEAHFWRRDNGEGPDPFLLRQMGVCLSNLNRFNEAIELFDQVLAINPKDYEALRNKGASLSNKGKEDEAIAFYDQALAINPRDYNALRYKGVSFSKLNREDEAIALYDQTLAINPKDYNALRNKGVSLSRQENENEAIALYDQALAINPKDYDSLRNKGVSLYKQGREGEAITLYDQALAINPRDYNALRNKGISLSQQSELDPAITCFTQALEIKGDDADTYRDLAVCSYNNGKLDGVFENIRRAASLDPRTYKDDFFLLARLVGKDAKEEWERLTEEIAREGVEGTVQQPSKTQTVSGADDPLSDIRGFVARIRSELGDRGNELITGIDSAKERVADFLLPESKREQDRSEFQILRKWNSYTPAIPAVAEDNRSRGGGYFIYHQGRGIVVDPGYNFIENFYEAAGRIHDIDTIVITHAHNDHTTDFESLCTLLHQYNSEIKENNRKTKDKKPSKKVTLYLNNGAYKKFSGLLNLQDHSYIDKVYTLNVGNRYELPAGVGLLVLPAFHDEIVSRDQSIGLLFTVSFDDGVIRRLLFTSDTGLFPLKLDATEFVPNTDGTRELWQQYPEEALNGVDVLVAHIGSVKKNEIVVDINEGVHECLYPNHLGVIGVCRMISQVPSQLAIVSEFGEELRNFRCLLVRQTERIVNEVLKAVPKKPVVLPGDLAFRYDIGASKVFCCLDNKWIACEDVRYVYKDVGRKEDILYLSQQALDRL